jgi:murein L,D-transpeptidase YcbB/YkuD
LLLLNVIGQDQSSKSWILRKRCPLVIGVMQIKLLKSPRTFFLSLLWIAICAFPMLGAAQSVAFKQSLAEAAHASKAPHIAQFYKDRNYKTLWVGRTGKDRQRRTQLFSHLAAVGTHGLPPSRYNSEVLKQALSKARTDLDRAQLEVQLTQVFLKYARDIQSGILTPRRIDKAMVRRVSYQTPEHYLKLLATARPRKLFESLSPQTPEYMALRKELQRLRELAASQSWGRKVPEGRTLKLGDTSSAVVALRDRLIAKEYLSRSHTKTFDADIEQAVRAFQKAHGLVADGVAGPSTLKELNKSAANRLRSVIVALERERWLGGSRGARHILVNIPEFNAKIIDNGRITFQTRTVVGAKHDDRPTPEFSDVMEHMVINPSWYVPRSIITKEYLPALQSDPYAVRHIEITDSRGALVNRSTVDFTQYDKHTFPYAMRQPPSRRNALGLVKFMFPNRHNIYLHDTPQKHLFSRESRAYSHGCVRLADPFDFAYALLAKQSSDPVGLFKKRLATNKESQVNLETHVPVHLIYRTAFSNERGQIEFRPDIYGRDAKVWAALARAGVVMLKERS